MARLMSWFNRTNRTTHPTTPSNPVVPRPNTAPGASPPASTGNYNETTYNAGSYSS